MAGAPLTTSLPIERPTATGTHSAEPFIEPFLAKHSAWYRRHSKVQPQQPQATPTAAEASPQRNNSVASSEAPESAAPVPASVNAGGVSSEQEAREARAEKAARRSSVVKALRWAFWYNGNE